MSRGGGGRDRFHSEYSPRIDEKERRSGWGIAPPSRHLWVGNLSQHVTQNMLSEQFLRFGDLDNISYIPGRSFAFVNFKKEEDAIIALRGLQGFSVAGMPLRIEFAKGDKSSIPPQNEEYLQYNDGRHSAERGESLLRRELKPQRPSPEKSYDKSKGNRSAEPSEMLWIGFPASLNVDEGALRRAFSPFGEIENISTFPGRTFAFVRYRSIVAACRAKEALQGKLFNNPRVHICFAKNDIPPEHGRGSSSGSLPPFKSNFHHSLNGQVADVFQRDRSFESPIREFHMESPRFMSNMDRMAGDAHVMGFGRNSSARAGAGPGPSFGGPFGHVRLPELGSERRMPEDFYEHNRSSPAADKTAPWLDFSIEKSQKAATFEESWGMDSGSFPFAKKLKTESFPDKELPEYPFSDFEQRKRDSGLPKSFSALPESFNKAFDSAPFGFQGVPDHPRNLLRPHTENDNFQRNFDGFGADPTQLPLNQVKPQVFNRESHKPVLNEEWKWEGTIAKGGTAICRARCFPVGKVLDFMLPEFLNCTARTGLDMLAKHYYQAASSWVVFFVPESDSDISFYNEFMHYLGEKQRAAVAKLGEKVTLFLVPPSDFSEQVLKVPGKVSISGVILKFQQPSSNFSSLNQPLEAMESKLPSLMHRPNEGINHHGDTSFAKANSPDYRPFSQGQNYFNSSGGHFTSITSTFPPPHKASDNLPYSGSVLPLEKVSDIHEESRLDQLQHQNTSMPSNWSSNTRIPNSGIGSFTPRASTSAPLPFDNPVVEEYQSANPRVVAQGMNPSKYAPEDSGIPPFSAGKFPQQLEDKAQVPSSMPIPLQPEQLAQLAALLGQQKQSVREPTLSRDGESKQPSLLQNLSSQPQASLPSHLLGPHIAQEQQHPSSVSAVQLPANNLGQQSNHQEANTSREETEADPQKRLQATLQLAASLLQQIQQRAKT